MVSELQTMCYKHFGRIDVTNHRIKLTPENTQPFHTVPLRVRPTAREFERMEMKEMLLQQMIKPSQTERAAPDVFASKKNGFLRFCVNFCRIIAVTMRDLYPIPRTDEFKDSLK